MFEGILAAAIGLLIAAIAFILGVKHGAGRASETTMVWLADKGYLRHSYDSKGEMIIHPYDEEK